MSLSVLLVFIVAVVLASFIIGKTRALKVSAFQGGAKTLNSLPYYYGMLTALWTGIPAVILLVLWQMFDRTIIDNLVVQYLPSDIQNMDAEQLGLVMNQVYTLVGGQQVGDVAPYVEQAAAKVSKLYSMSEWLQTSLITLAMMIGAFVVYKRIHPEMKARNHIELFFKYSLLGCACIAIITTLGIVFSVLFESILFFQKVPVSEFLFGTQWSPQMAIRKDQVGSSGSFGAVPLFMGTMLIALIALIVAVPTGLMSAIYLAEYAPKKIRSIFKPLLEILAGIPTVVYGFFAALTVAPFIRDLAYSLGLNEYISVSSESALAAGLVMGVMIIPFVSSLSDDVINAVPQSLRDGALGLGATKSEVVKQVVIPAALPGIVGGVLLAASRAIGETMIVVMAAGMAANLTANPLDSVTTVTVQIVTLLVGDQEFDSPKTLAAFALGLMLFIVTLALNYIALHVVKKYREQYD